jgi:hypothetical protein
LFLFSSSKSISVSTISLPSRWHLAKALYEIREVTEYLSSLRLAFYIRAVTVSQIPALDLRLARCVGLS